MCIDLYGRAHTTVIFFENVMQLLANHVRPLVFYKPTLVYIFLKVTSNFEGLEWHFICVGNN